MKQRRYTILLYPDEEEGGYTVLVPALPGVVTQGETMEEAMAVAKEAIQLHADGRDYKPSKILSRPWTSESTRGDTEPL